MSHIPINLLKLIFLLSDVCDVCNPEVIYRVKLIESRMASAKSANKETPSCDKREGRGLEEDFKKLKLKEEACLDQEGGKKKEEKAEAKEEEEKPTGKEIVASKGEKTVEVGPEEFLKHPLQVAFGLKTWIHKCFLSGLNSLTLWCIRNSLFWGNIHASSGYLNMFDV